MLRCGRTRGLIRALRWFLRHAARTGGRKNVFFTQQRERMRDHIASLFGADQVAKLQPVDKLLISDDAVRTRAFDCLMVC